MFSQGRRLLQALGLGQPPPKTSAPKYDQRKRVTPPCKLSSLPLPKPPQVDICPVDKVKQWLFKTTESEDISADRSGSHRIVLPEELSTPIDSRVKLSSKGKLQTEDRVAIPVQFSNAGPSGNFTRKRTMTITGRASDSAKIPKLSLKENVQPVGEVAEPTQYDITPTPSARDSCSKGLAKKRMTPVSRTTVFDSITPDDPKPPTEGDILSGLIVRKELFPTSVVNAAAADVSFEGDHSSLHESVIDCHFDHTEASEINLSPGALLLPLDEPIQSDNIFVVESVDNVTEVAADTEVAAETEEDTAHTEEDTAQTEEDTAQDPVRLPNINQNQSKRKRQNVPNEESPTKKRKMNPSKWKAFQAKLAYNSGVFHTSLRGKEVAARAMKPGCGAACRRGCQARLSPEAREAAFTKYWSLKDKILQWSYLLKLVRILDVKRRKVIVDDDDEAFRKHSYEYNIIGTNGQIIPVCQKMFLDTFSISITVVKTALNKNSPDKRGKHTTNRRRLHPLLVSSVKDHIKSFPVVESHYCRKDTRKRYLDEHLSVAKMHRLYLMGRNNMPHTANLRQYRDIFNNSFNLGFYKPKKDRCALCAEWDSLKGDQRAHKAQAYNNHIKAKEQVRQLRKEDKELSRNEEAKEETGKNIRVVTFDLQKVLYVPKCEIAEFFYKRKLSCYNFTMYDCTTKQAVCYVWDQTTGQRGSDEISSFVLDFIEENVKKNGVNDFRFYSDSCSGQNKNQFLYSMYHLAAIKFNVRITHRYLEKGHTQMECDSVHARIEKKTKQLAIFVPSEWYGYIRSAKVKKPPYVTKEVTQENIFSFKDIAKHFVWSKVPISKIREVVLDSTSPGKTRYRLDFDSNNTELDVLSKKPGRPINWKTLKLSRAYDGPLPVKQKVLNDLKWYTLKDLIPNEHLQFYQNLIQGRGIDDEDENDLPEEVNAEVVFYEESEGSDADEPEAEEEEAQHNQNNDDDDASTDSETFD